MFRVLCLFVFTIMMSVTLAQDLSDNEVCLECHEPTVTVVHEGHIPDWSCIDCHDYIVEAPHSEDVIGADVDCLNCHDEVPVIE